MPPKILLVDDEKGLVKGLSHTLQREGFDVDAAYDGMEALEKFSNQNVDLIVLDLMLPQMNGLDVCRKVREKSSVPIIMLTAKGEDVDRIVGLELGADDYLPKPFSSRELLARINALLRRTKTKKKTEQEAIRIGDIIIDFPSQAAEVDGRKIEFTRKEFTLLTLLVKNIGRVFSRHELLEKVWGTEYYDLRTVDVCVGRIRKKIESDPTEPEYIKTRWGVGYYFTEYKDDV